MNAFKSTKPKVILGVLIFLSMNIFMSRLTPFSSIDCKVSGSRDVVCGANRGPSASRGCLFTQKGPESRRIKKTQPISDVRN